MTGSPDASMALNSRQVEELTDIVFLPTATPEPCDAIFVFGGTYPGHWQQALDAYRKGYAPRLIVTGGVKAEGFKHPTWPDPQMPEAEGIRAKLMEGGVSPHAIVFENRSRNTRENVLFSQEATDFSEISSVILVGKSFGTGRAYRTFLKNMPHGIRCIPYGFDTDYRGHFISRHHWMQSSIGQNLVVGEYLKILRYSRIGHVLSLERQVDGLQEYVERYMRD